jgi:hypothetical protein
MPQSPHVESVRFSKLAPIEVDSQRAEKKLDPVAVWIYFDTVDPPGVGQARFAADAQPLPWAGREPNSKSWTENIDDEGDAVILRLAKSLD